MRSLVPLEAVNAARSATAAARTCDRVRTVLDRFTDGGPENVSPATWARLTQAGRLRLEHPGDSITALAARAGMTKDAMAGCLRRLTRATNP